MTIQQVKQRFGIIGDSPLLNRAIDIAMQVAPTDLSVLITGESGTGKEAMPQIIHQLSTRKHGPYIAVNCGAIPEGTIDSELFGHEKGSFTGAHEARKGYFEVANGGTIFMDEVAELPLQTQARFLRVLESGEFIRVGSSKVLKTNVRIVAATNVKIPDAIQKGKFREDLYYRLNTVPIIVPALKERKEDIHLLFRKFATDFADKYKMPPIKLDNKAKEILINYPWPGNIRQLKNVTEQVSIIEKTREINAEQLLIYLPQDTISKLPALYKGEGSASEFSERDILYKVLFDMRRDITDLKNLVFEIIQRDGITKELRESHAGIINKLSSEQHGEPSEEPSIHYPVYNHDARQVEEEENEHEVVEEESLSLEETEIGLIKKALIKNKGKRKNAAKELGISERTLYRKIKEYGII
ncbi:MAG: sigma-54-dependent Fis family transcriptional regulator [Bacteroidetes bacterium]|nr:sigma-54-dependent Fis family transcriptional regulator [Bacteroidota bacterium]HET6243250.1 sigma-54 dependent transcriptional regulator [Bacteroidia bacterium]